MIKLIHDKYIAGLASLLLLACIQPASSANASTMDKETFVKFPAPVEIPGRVLPAGRYVFKIANDGEAQNVVHIFSEDEANRLRLAGTEFTIPVKQSEPQDKATFYLEERPAGNPDALGRWFYPGVTEGYEFVYPKKHASANVGSTVSSNISSRIGDSAFAPFVCDNSDGSKNLNFRLCYKHALGAISAGR